MTDQQPGTHGYEHLIEVHAPADAVWPALTEEDQITAWYTEDARVTPGEGGSYWVSWGEGLDGESRIEVWKPGEHLRLAQLPPPGDNVEAPNLDAPIVEEFFLESRGDVTIVRMVCSNIPRTPEWDGFYDGTKRGWWGYLRMLRHYVERHRGQRRRCVLVMTPITVPAEQAWQSLTGAEGFGFDHLDERAPGDRFTAVTADGDQLEGDVIALTPGTSLMVNIDTLDDALLGFAIEPMEPTMLVLQGSLFGLSEDEAQRIHRRWTQLVKRALGAPADGGGSA